MSLVIETFASICPNWRKSRFLYKQYFHEWNWSCWNSAQTPTVVVAISLVDVSWFSETCLGIMFWSLYKSIWKEAHLLLVSSDLMGLEPMSFIKKNPDASNLKWSKHASMLDSFKPNLYFFNHLLFFGIYESFRCNSNFSTSLLGVKVF